MEIAHSDDDDYQEVEPIRLVDSDAEISDIEDSDSDAEETSDDWGDDVDDDDDGGGYGGSYGDNAMRHQSPALRGILVAIQNCKPSSEIKALIDQNPEVTETVIEGGRMLLHVAFCLKASFEVIEHILSKCPKSASVKDKASGTAPLNYACLRMPLPPLSLFRKLITAAPQAICVQDGIGHTPLTYAAEGGYFCRGSLELIQCMVKAYPVASIMTDCWGNLPLETAQRRKKSDKKKVIRFMTQATTEASYGLLEAVLMYNRGLTSVVIDHAKDIARSIGITSSTDLLLSSQSGASSSPPSTSKGKKLMGKLLPGKSRTSSVSPSITTLKELLGKREVRDMLNEKKEYRELINGLIQMNVAGRSYFLQNDKKKSKLQSLEVLSAVSTNVDCLFIHLRENPSLCYPSSTATTTENLGSTPSNATYRVVHFDFCSNINIASLYEEIVGALNKNEPLSSIERKVSRQPQVLEWADPITKQTILHHACMVGKEDWRTNGHTRNDIIKHLLKKNPMAAKAVDGTNRTPLHYYLCTSNQMSEQVLQLLGQQFPEAIGIANKFSGWTPLHCVCNNDTLPPGTGVIEEWARLCPIACLTRTNVGRLPLDVTQKGNVDVMTIATQRVATTLIEKLSSSPVLPWPLGVVSQVMEYVSDQPSEVTAIKSFFTNDEVLCSQ